MLRQSPRLTPASLAARRANALKSTGPRTHRGKAWSCLNALRHGRRARNLRAKIERTGDRQALLLFDWIFVNLMERWRPPTEWEWRRTAREAVRAWCFLTGRMLLPRLKGNGLRTGATSFWPTYRYGDHLVCPSQLKITDKYGIGIRFRNPMPSRRKHANHSWVPTVEFFAPPPKLPRARRVAKDEWQVASDNAATPERSEETMLAAYHSSLATSSQATNPAEAKENSQTNLECDAESAICLGNPQEAIEAALRQLAARHPSIAAVLGVPGAPATSHSSLATSSEATNPAEARENSQRKLESKLE